MNEEIQAGDKVRIREDATTEGKPFGEVFLQLTYIVVKWDPPNCELSAKYMASELHLHTLCNKIRRA